MIKYQDFFFWKNLESVYIGSSPTVAKLLGFQRVDDLVGKHDHEIPCDVAEGAEQFVKEDRKVIQETTPIRVFRRYPLVTGELKTLLMHKSLLRNEANEPIAIQAYITEVSNKILTDFTLQLENDDTTKFLGEASKKKIVSYYLSSGYGNLGLSNRESECLFHVIRGKSTRSIAELLHLSPRTVESHVEHIKNKMGVDRKEEVIEKALEMGFMEIIPDGILSNQLNGFV